MRRFLKTLVALMLGALQIVVWTNWELHLFSELEITTIPDIFEILNRAGLPMLTAFMVFLIPNRIPRI